MCSSMPGSSGSPNDRPGRSAPPRPAPLAAEKLIFQDVLPELFLPPFEDSLLLLKRLREGERAVGRWGEATGVEPQTNISVSNQSIQFNCSTKMFLLTSKTTERINVVFRRVENANHLLHLINLVFYRLGEKNVPQNT